MATIIVVVVSAGILVAAVLQGRLERQRRSAVARADEAAPGAAHGAAPGAAHGPATERGHAAG